jgi:hypothetical protein
MIGPLFTVTDMRTLNLTRINIPLFAWRDRDSHEKIGQNMRLWAENTIPRSSKCETANHYPSIISIKQVSSVVTIDDF